MAPTYEEALAKSYLYEMTNTDMNRIPDAQQRKRIQNRVAQRTYRERFKRRIENLEKWRDVAITATCSLTAHVDPRIGSFHHLEHGAARPEQEPKSLAAPLTSLSPPSISTPLWETTECSLMSGPASRAPDASHLLDNHQVPSVAWMPPVDSYNLLPNDFAGNHDFTGWEEQQQMESLNHLDLQQVDQNDRMCLNPLAAAHGGGEEHLSMPPWDVHNSKTPLHLAAERGEHSLTKILLDRMADATAQDSMGRTALHLAVGYKHIEVVRVLLGHQQRQESSLINIQDNDGRSALHIAVEIGQDIMVSVLLRVSNIDIELRNSQGRTALHMAVLQGSNKGIELLLTAGADANARVQRSGSRGAYDVQYSVDAAIDSTRCHSWNVEIRRDAMSTIIPSKLRDVPRSEF